MKLLDWLPRLLVALVLSAALSGACGTTGADGKCKNYEPLDFCGADFEYVCDTTDDGCRQCTCEPRRPYRDDEPLHGPLGPNRNPL